MAAQAIAQNYFNRRETLYSRAVVLTSVIPINNSYYSVGICLDSINHIDESWFYNVWGIKFAKFSAIGDVVIDTVFQKPHMRPNIWSWDAKSILLEDNTILVAAQNTNTNNKMYLGLYCFDTTGHVLWEREYEQPGYPDIDSNFWLMDDFKRTSDGHWLMLSSIWSPDKSGDMLLTKLDSDFNVIWHQRYGDSWYEVPGRVIETDSGYLVAGRRDNNIGSITPKLTGQVEFLKTDTAGNVQGTWRTDTSHLHSFVWDIVRTSDGGYLYVATGEGWQDSVYYEAYHYNGWIEKLDSNLNSEWGRIIGLGDYSTPYRVYEKENGDIHVFGEIMDTSVIFPIQHVDGYWITLDGATGNTLRTRKYNGIHSNNDWNTFYDARPTPDGGYVMVGDANDQSSTVIQPNDRAWIVKVDSTGCLGPDDPQCQPTGVMPPGMEQMQIAIYPNPVSNVLTVELPQGMSAQLELMDMQGRMALGQALNGGMQQIGVQSLVAGNYLYRITEKGRLLARGKLVKR